MLTAIGLTPGGSITAHRLSGIRTQSGQTKINDELRKNYSLMGRVRAVPRLWELHHGICLTTEEKAREKLGDQWIEIYSHLQLNGQ